MARPTLKQLQLESEVITSQLTSEYAAAKVAASQASIDGVASKTDNLPADPAGQSDVEDAITAAHSTTDGKIDAIKSQTDLIDEAAVDGLSGCPNSLAYKVHEIEKHFHNSEQWFGKNSGDNLFDRDSVTPFALVAGTSQAYGTEVQLSDGTEVEGGSTTMKMDLHEVLIVDNDASNAVTTFKIEFWYGTGLFAAAALLTECVATFYAIADNHGVVQLITPRIACNNKLWARIKCSVNSKSISILVGLHTYDA